MTQQALRSAVEALLVDREQVALCLDFDGTLAPIVQNPDDAALPEETRRHVTALAGAPTVDVAVISGRALDDVRSRVGVAGIKYAGNHGFELSDAGETWIHPAVEQYRPALERARERIERELDSIPGSFVEDKHATLTVHHRQATREEGSSTIATVQAVVDGEAGLSMAVDDQAVEVRPDIDHHKGDAVEELIDVDSKTLVIYLGDARTDVDAFRTLASSDDESVRVAVGNDLPASGHRLESPADVQRFLGWLRAELVDPED